MMCIESTGALGDVCGGSAPPCDGTKGLYCAGQAGMRACAPFALVGNGQPCGTLANGTFASCTAGTCYDAAGMVTSGADEGTCKAVAMDGQPCDAAKGPGCMTPARCIVGGAGTAGVCTLPKSTDCS
jgi:hypothetical protein